jgi:Flp pilus assembly protein TadG
MALAGGRTGERGSVAVLLALALTVLLGFAALVVDIGLSWAVRAEAQTAADAAALAGAARLADGPAGAVTAVRQYLDANVPGLADRRPTLTGRSTAPTTTARWSAGRRPPRRPLPGPAARPAPPPCR